MEAAGSVEIQISGNLTPLETAFAKGEQMTLAFNAKVSSILSGSGLSAGLEKISAGVDQTNALLAKLTTSGTSASATLSKVTASTTATTEALSKVAVATKAVNAEMASIGGSSGAAAALESGAISAKAFAQALEQTGGRLDRITPAMLGLATETEGLATANVRTAATTSEVAAGMETVAITSRTAAAGMTALGAAETEAAGLGAGVTREFSVLGAEVARGNFSRIPGSLIVLNERLVSTGTSVLTLSNFMKAFGGLASVIFNPYVIGFLGLTIGTDLAIKGFDKLSTGSSDLTKNLKDQADELTALGKSYKDVAAAANSFSVDGLTSFGLSSTATIHGLQLDIANKTKDFTSTVGYLGGFDSSNPFQIYDDFKPFEDAINHLRETAAAGAPDILGFKKMIEDRWALDPNNEALTKSASELEDLVKDALSASVALQKLKQAQDDMRSRGGEGDAVIANMIEAGNTAAEALKAADQSFGMSGLTAYESAVTGINQKFDDMIVKAHAVGAAFETFNQARDLSLQQASLKALSSITFDKPIAGANALGLAIAGVGNSADGVKVELGGMAAPIVNITQLFAKAKLDQLIGLQSATNELEVFKTQLSDVQVQLEQISKTSPNLLFGAGDKGTASDITAAYNAIDQVFKLWDTGDASVMAVHNEIERVRASLIALGGDSASVNTFINSIVQGEERVRQLNSDVLQLGSSIAHLPNKTVTITIKTQRIGSGTQSLYDVGGGNTVGVTRYGANPGDQSGPSVTANQVSSYSGGGEASGSGSSYGLSGGTSTVNVWRFNSGGMIHPGDTQQVSFFKSPDETVGIFTPGQMQALADPQSGFTGTQPTANDNRAWTVLMNVEANTRKTAQILDDIKTASASASSSLGGSSYSGGSSGGDTSQQDQLSAQYMNVLKQIKSNFQAAGIIGRGIIGYGLDGLAASPQEIARNIVYGGASPLGAAGSTSYERDMAKQNQQVSQSFGFNTGGMIAPGDSQEVKFFKSPEETVAIFTPQQMNALQGANQNQSTQAANDQRPIQFSQTNHWNGNTPPSQDSLAAVRRATALGFMDAQRAARGR
ncbi:hypothetical protein [Mesorhizobium sp. B2-7-1]|uniref:hypothetical protein n=1 Tax=Mesorhizobium sp. B2-7-1 TaxID=2589909 RepID=UPI00112C7581|nr:hypothetical protein [Mesorhizobium sp. B2-7-1]TPJ46845.1 hypothetical protein FJ471_31420 [Mesorhizobium sp. B2-7-1]